MGAKDFHARLADELGEFVKRRDRLEQGDIVARAKSRGYRLSQASVSRWINEEATPRIEGAEALAAALGVTPEWLAFGRGQRYEAERGGLASVARRRIIGEDETTATRRKAVK